MNAIASLRRGLARTLSLGFLGTLVGAGGIAITGVSCASAPDENRVTEIIQPDFAIYKTDVDDYLNRRCGTLDCHGQFGRAYRLYGRNGLRLIDSDLTGGASTADGGAEGGAPSKGEELVTGEQPTTDAEVLANFQSLIAIEPEEMSRVIAAQGQDADEKLVILRKPMRKERHKGGKNMDFGDSAYRCLTGWLSVPVVNGLGETIPTSQRVLPDNIKRFCAEAKTIP